MNNALRTGIYTLGKTVTGLSAANLYFDNAKDSQSGQYCVFWSVDNPLTWDSASVFEVDNVQFDFYGANPSNLETLVSNFEAVFDFGKDSLTVSGYSVITMTRNLKLRHRRSGKVWRITCEYRIETQKAR